MERSESETTPRTKKGQRIPLARVAAQDNLRYREFETSHGSEDECTPIIEKCVEYGTVIIRHWQKIRSNKELSDDADEMIEKYSKLLKKLKFQSGMEFDQLVNLKRLLMDFRKLVKKVAQDVWNVSRHRRRQLIIADQAIHEQVKIVLHETTSDGVGSMSLTEIAVSKISSSDGREWWKKSFTGYDLANVPWPAFVHAYKFSISTKISQRDERFIKRIIDFNGSENISPQEFDSYLKAFGPLTDSLSNVMTLSSQPWWHGFLSSDEASRLLTEKPAGTFLVRFSRSKAHKMALEYVDKAGIHRTALITCNQPSGVSIEEDSGVEMKFANVIELVAYYSQRLTKPFTSDLLGAPGFLGRMTPKEARQLLSYRPPGTFAIHFYGAGTQMFYISFVTSGGVACVALEKVPTGFKFIAAKEVEELESDEETQVSEDTDDECEANTSATGSASSPSLNKSRISSKEGLSASASATSSSSPSLIGSDSVMSPGLTRRIARSDVLAKRDNFRSTHQKGGVLPPPQRV